MAGKRRSVFHNAPIEKRGVFGGVGVEALRGPLTSSWIKETMFESI